MAKDLKLSDEDAAAQRERLETLMKLAKSDSQRAFADHIGLEYRRVNNWFNGHAIGREGEDILAEEFGVSVEWVRRGEKGRLSADTIHALKRAKGKPHVL